MKKLFKQNELIKRAKSGDHSAFKELVMLLEPKVATTVIGMLGNSQESEDVGQETFIRLYKALKDFRGEANIETYVTRIAINLSLNELKRRKRRTMFFPFRSESEVKNLPSGINDIEQNETQEFVSYAIQQLEPHFRSVIVLRLIDGYSIKETAELLKIPEGTVLSRLARAQKKLKTILAPLMGR